MNWQNLNIAVMLNKLKKGKYYEKINQRIAAEIW